MASLRASTLNLLRLIALKKARCLKGKMIMGIFGNNCFFLSCILYKMNGELYAKTDHLCDVGSRRYTACRGVVQASTRRDHPMEPWVGGWPGDCRCALFSGRT